MNSKWLIYFITWNHILLRRKQPKLCFMITFYKRVTTLKLNCLRISSFEEIGEICRNMFKTYFAFCMEISLCLFSSLLLGIQYVPKYQEEILCMCCFNKCTNRTHQRKRKLRIGSVLTCGFRMLFFHVKLGEFSVASSCDLPNFGVKDLDVRLLVPSKKNSTGANPFWKEKQRSI